MLYPSTSPNILKTTLLIFTLINACVGYAHPIIPSLHSNKISDQLQGHILTEELNCTACHKSHASFATKSKQSPRLSDIGSRINPHYLEAFITDPHNTKPGTTMPDLLTGMTPEKKASVAKSITHFLLSTKPNNFSPIVPDQVAAHKGQQLFHSRGCVACHSPRDEKGNELLPKTSAPLGNLSKKYSHHSLVEFLTDPLKTRPSGRMPKLDLPPKEINDIAHYLLRNTKIPGHINYTLHHGSIWEGIHTDGVTAIKSGHTPDFNLSNLDNQRRTFAVEYESWLNITTPGDHTFYLTMNGGSLTIDGQQLFNKQPSQLRAPTNFQKTIHLQPGLKKIKLTYYNTGDSPALSVEIKTPSSKRAPIPTSLLSVSKQPITKFKPITLDPHLITQGRHHFTSLGCASCHDDLAIKSTTTHHTPFAKLTPNKGCLTPPNKIITSSNTPNFHLSPHQHTLIQSSLQTATQPLTDKQQINKTLTTFNCTACHHRSDVGGIDPARLHTFTTTHPELGDQGRIPPTLNNIGAKLQPKWLHQVLTEGKRQRHYMNLTMPQYGESNIAHLTPLFAKVDSLETVTFPEIANIKESKNAGYNMIGPKGFSCIACHHFNGKNSSGAGALDLVNTTNSLQKNWFHLFMQNPSRFHNTGIMPNFWPSGKSIRPDLLEGKPDQQIEALWEYLADGPRAKKPQGLSRQTNQVRVFDKAEIVRGRGTAGFRGIGVGYPQRLNLAFDSQEMALRLLWKGPFADINHGSFKVSGTHQIPLPPGIPFHRLESLENFWPYKAKTNHTFPQDHGYQFRGYKLDKLRRPTFQYQYGHIKIDDFFQDIASDNHPPKLLRTFTFNTTTPQTPFYFRAAAGQKITTLPNNTYTIDKLTIRILGDHKPIIRKTTPSDLLIPIQLQKGTTKLTIEYQW